jgi:phosphoribosylamine--glycine ligase
VLPAWLAQVCTTLVALFRAQLVDALVAVAAEIELPLRALFHGRHHECQQGIVRIVRRGRPPEHVPILPGVKRLIVGNSCERGLVEGQGRFIGRRAELRKVGEALAHAAACLARGNPDRPAPVLVEEYLDGPELSLFCLTDGSTVLPMAPAQDFKRVGDGDTGPNTGGMGAYAPLPWLPDDVTDQIVIDIVKPVAAELVHRGSPFSGLLYAGLAITSQGPAVVEFNCRFGDPETQSVLALLESPLGQLLHAAATGSLAEQPQLRWRDGAAVTVVLAAENYPGRPRVGDVIVGAEADGVLHAGTARRDDGAIVSCGGRVLSVVGTGSDLAAARDDLLGSIQAALTRAFRPAFLVAAVLAVFLL